MNRQKAIIVSGLLVAGITASVCYALIQEKDEPAEPLRFSTTQTWDPTLLAQLPHNLDPITRAKTETYLAQISLPPPPENDSDRTTMELAKLHEWSNTERRDAQADIEAERYAENLRFGTYVYGSTDKPETRELLLDAHAEIIPVILAMKQEFDRVRPNYLDPTLTTAIAVPDHPAYPSGHATESYMLALLLSELDPENAEVYKADAIRIAHNREIAGVHYPSDSEAGRMLATAFIELYLESKQIQDRIATARTEWQ